MQETCGDRLDSDPNASNSARYLCSTASAESCVDAELRSVCLSDTFTTPCLRVRTAPEMPVHGALHVYGLLSPCRVL